MRPSTLRRIVSTLGIVIAACVAILPTVGFVIEKHHGVQETLDYRGQLIAARLSSYIHENGKLWEYQNARVRDLIDVPLDGDVSKR